MASHFAQRLIKDEVPRFPPFNFGIPALDRVIQGVRPGFVNLIVGRPHSSKTRVVIQGIANNPDLPVLFISADDDPDVVVRKMMHYAGVVADGWQATPQQMAEFVEERYPNLDIVDHVAWGPAHLNGERPLADIVEAFDQVVGRPPGLIVYDYLGISGGDLATTISTSAWQKEVVKTLPMPVIVLAQSNRQAARFVIENNERVRRGFRMEDLSYGGEQQAGLIVGLTPAEYDIAGRLMRCVEVDIVKNKAVFDDSGITNTKTPIVLATRNGVLMEKGEAAAAFLNDDSYSRFEAGRGMSGMGEAYEYRP